MHVLIVKSDAKSREKPCLRCGYSLRKIDSTHCPECGLSVWISLNQNDNLDGSNPTWQRKMSVGLWIMSGAQILGLVAFCLLLFPGVLGRRNAYGWAVVAMPIAAAYLVLFHAGLLFLTAHEHRYPDRMKGWRYGAFAVTAAAAVVTLLFLTYTFSFNRLGTGFLTTVFDIILLAGALITLGYLRIIARRIPNATLGKLCAWLMLLPLLSFAKSVPFFSIFLIHEVVYLLQFFPLLYLPVSIALFIWFSIYLRRSAVHATQHWKNETAMTP